MLVDLLRECQFETVRLGPHLVHGKGRFDRGDQSGVGRIDRRRITAVNDCFSGSRSRVAVATLESLNADFAGKTYRYQPDYQPKTLVIMFQRGSVFSAVFPSIQ